MTTEQRLERLERENRWMRRIGAVGVAVAAAVFLIGQGKDKELHVQSLRVGGKDGWATLSAKHLSFMDKARTLRVLLTREHGGASLMFADGNGKLRAVLSTTEVGSTRLRLSDHNDEMRALLRVLPDGSPSLGLYDKNGRDRAVLGVTTTVDKKTGAETKTAESTLTLYDAKGKVIWKAPKD
ncbi:MAG: hypothetical protein ACYS0K_22055 [Planctomycetota bacterium]|jgi:hypothetical protein